MTNRLSHATAETSGEYYVDQFRNLKSPIPLRTQQVRDMRRLTTGIRSEKCVVRRFRRCANVIECAYTNLDSIAYYKPRLYGIAYCF